MSSSEPNDYSSAIPGPASPPGDAGSVFVPRLLVVGASARAAAHSALRAGLLPAAIDLFTDRDLAELAPCARIARETYPDALPELAGDMPDGPWIYTGAMENHPETVRALAADRPLWGNPADVLRAVRDPARLHESLRRAGLPSPEVRLRREGLPRDASWLAKPIASSAGHGIVPLSPAAALPRTPCYFQARVEGEPLAAIFLGAGSGARLLGVTRQFLGRPGAPYAYVGSLGPWPIPSAARATLVRIGDFLARDFDLMGLFGVDFVLRGTVPWPVEVNPRYTASVEVLERATGASFLAMHAAVFDRGRTVEVNPGHRGAGVSFVAKSILFADHDFEFPPGVALRGRERATGGTSVADIPSAGTPIGAGEPVLTVFARGGSIAECSHRLEWSLNRWRRRLNSCQASRISQTSGIE